MATAADDDAGRDGLDATELLLIGARRQRLLTPAEELELARRIERGDLEAKEQLVLGSLRLVVSIARHHQVTAQMPLADLVQEGMLGLIRAAEKFDWRRGLKFSTYATVWIRQAIQRGLDNQGRTIRIPVALAQQERKIAAAQRRLITTLGREPSPDELARATGLAADQIRAVAGAPRAATSLDRPVTGEDETTLGALLPADGPDLGEAIVRRQERDCVRRAVAALSEPERSVICLRFGLDGDDDPQSHAAIGRRLGLARENVPAIEGLALRRLAADRELESQSAA